MKKSSGFEKFFKGKAPSGAAKKEAIRKEKREVRKEREESIAAKKRAARADKRSSQGNYTGTKMGKDEIRNLDPDRKRKFSIDKEKSRPGFKKQVNRPNEADKPPTKSPGYQYDSRRNDGNSAERKASGFNKPRSQRDGFSGAGRKSNDFQNRGNRRTEFRPSEKKSFGTQTYSRDTQQPAAQGARQKPVIEKPKTSSAVKSGTASDEMPLNKYIAHSGVCSRRDAVTVIKAGKVKVNGELVLEPGFKVKLSDTVAIAGKKITPQEDLVYILLNKPKDYITTTDDPQQRKTVLDLLKGATDARIYPVGRLDRNTSGVLLLTNDGELSQKLTHPSNEIKKLYAVTLDKPLTKNDYEAILQGTMLEDGLARVDALAFTDSKDPREVGIEIHSGKNRIVRRIFEHYGYDVKGLDRVIFAGLTKKNVNRGKWRFLTEKEVRDLKFFKKGR